MVYRPNSCPICLICIECSEFYGISCTCESKKIRWNKKKEGYCVDFRHKALTDKNSRLKLDSTFAIWFFKNISSQIEIQENQNDVNVCHKCINKFDYYKSLYQFYLLFCYFKNIYSIYIFIVNETNKSEKSVNTLKPLCDLIDLTDAEAKPVTKLPLQNLSLHNTITSEVNDAPLKSSKQNQPGKKIFF